MRVPLGKTSGMSLTWRWGEELWDMGWELLLFLSWSGCLIDGYLEKTQEQTLNTGWIIPLTPRVAWEEDKMKRVHSWMWRKSEPGRKKSTCSISNLGIMSNQLSIHNHYNDCMICFMFFINLLWCKHWQRRRKISPWLIFWLNCCKTYASPS